MATSRIINPATNKPFAYERRPVRVRRAAPQSRYDAAQTVDDNRRHWANADALSARAANDPAVRATLRNRSRYEFDNNGYCQGLVLTLADDMVGTGPSLQMLSDSEDANREVEAKFSAWCEAVGFTDLLHTGKIAKTRCGEPFWLFTDNPELSLLDGTPSPVTLDLQETECDQIASPWGVAIAEPWVDGIELDRRGRPTYYHVLKRHPGDTFPLSAGPGDYRRVPARQVIHWFRKSRPGQCRGVPEITPSLPLFAQLRRYTLATLTAAETAANFSALLETEAPPDGEDVPDPFETLEIERNLMMTLPAGAKLAQLKAEQPVTAYGDFKAELLKEIGRPVSAPFNLTAGDSSPYNYSSARLDHILYRSAVRVERERCRRVVLERVFAEWVREALLIPGFIPAGVTAATKHVWRWTGFESIDPLKEALADTERLSNGTATLAGILAEQGADWEPHVEQRGREVRKLREEGVPLPGAAAPAQPPADASPDGGDPGDAGDPPASRKRLTDWRLRAEVLDAR